MQSLRRWTAATVLPDVSTRVKRAGVLDGGRVGHDLRAVGIDEPETAVIEATSNDGTRVAYWRSGSGPPLILVHGTTADHTRWGSLLPRLEQHFTVCARHRRARGDGAEHAIRREIEDLAAAVESIRSRSPSSPRAAGEHSRNIDEQRYQHAFSA